MAQAWKDNKNKEPEPSSKKTIDTNELYDQIAL
jgi:hypothetical protein